MKTLKGTELPILNLRGKDYLEVKYRIVWFREEHPTWSIETEFVPMAEKNAAMAKATIRDENGRAISTSHKTENSAGFPDYFEKAETGAIGRALALIGYGTQFCADELDEGERIVDSPVTKKPSPETKSVNNNPLKMREPLFIAPKKEEQESESIGEYLVSFGKFNGRALREIPLKDLKSYISFIEHKAMADNKPIMGKVKEFFQAVHAYEQELAG